MYFPVRGHSYLPADRVFGRIERKLRKAEEILTPSGYYKIYQEAGNVRVLGKDWLIKNYKDLTTILKKIEGISEIKRTLLRKVRCNNDTEVKIKLHPTYSFEDTSKTFSSLAKRGYRLSRDMTDRSNLPLVGKVKEDKKVDVLKLLQARFGNDWESNIPLTSLSFFNDVLNATSEDNTEATEDIAEENICDCLEEEPGMTVV